MNASNRPLRGIDFANATPAPPPPMAPLNQRLATCVSRMEVMVNRSEQILNRLRPASPEISGDMPEPQPVAHDIADRMDYLLDRLDKNTSHILDLL